MEKVARVVNRYSGGRLSPNAVTIIGFAAHMPIALLIAYHDNVLAAILLVIFGLFDTLDGDLARLQKRTSQRGALLDASTDRMKEVLLYSGAAYALVHSSHPDMAVWAVAACGASLCVSYVKAKGEAAVANTGMSQHDLNHIFHDGLLRFEVRMALLVLGLLIDQLGSIVAIIAVLATYTAFQRLILISKKL